MKKPDIPEDEQARLTALRSLDILDTPAEERFDRLTRMAKRMFDVPIALVSLVDDHRQWFKSRVGLDATETPRDISFCGHTILGNDVFVIPDAIEDERFADNPLVTGDPSIRFYAGCPLTAPDGSKLGTLCVIDQQPRTIEDDDVVALKDLAAMVETELAAVHLATLDELTGISNRRGFMLLAQQSVQLCVRHKIPASLTFLDLDGFKKINDEFGHAEGDRVLTVLGDLMRKTFRESDVYGRLGGDEFVALLVNATKKFAEDSMQRFRQSLKKYNKNINRGYEISLSYGVVEMDPDRRQTIETLLADADSLMYEIKSAKR